MFCSVVAKMNRETLGSSKSSATRGSECHSAPTHNCLLSRLVKNASAIGRDEKKDKPKRVHDNWEICDTKSRCDIIQPNDNKSWYRCTRVVDDIAIAWRRSEISLKRLGECKLVWCTQNRESKPEGLWRSITSPFAYPTTKVSHLARALCTGLPSCSRPHTLTGRFRGALPRECQHPESVQSVTSLVASCHQRQTIAMKLRALSLCETPLRGGKGPTSRIVSGCGTEPHAATETVLFP